EGVGPRSASPSPHAQDHASITFPIAPNSAWLPMPLSTDWGGFVGLDYGLLLCYVVAQQESA
ncbi:MAG: hypothetical protein ABSF71_29565, partial [Terriglobia bacterium]